MKNSIGDEYWATQPQKSKWQPGEFILNRFKINEILYGATGQIYIVEDANKDCSWTFTSRSNRLAIKTFSDMDILNKKHFERFEKEARIWASVPPCYYIVQALFVLMINQIPHIFMEYAEDNSLRYWIANSKLDIATTLIFGIDICRGMDFAYQNGIIAHRDLKPENVLVAKPLIVFHDENERVAKVSDFGLAAAFEEEIINDFDIQKKLKVKTDYPYTLREGSIPYMAPECFSNLGEIGPTVDIYSFGIMFYEMLTKELPSSIIYPNHQTSLPNFSKCLKEKNIPINLIPILTHLLYKCLDKDPEQRYSSFIKIENDLIAAIDSIPIPEETRILYRTKSELPIVPADLIDMGLSLHRLGEFDEAIRQFDKVLTFKWDKRIIEKSSSEESKMRREVELREAQVEAIIRKADSFNQLGKSSEAIMLCNKAISIEPKNEEAWLTKARITESNDSQSAAIDCLNKGLMVNPNSLTLLKANAEYHAHAGRMKDALILANKALDLEPDNVFASSLKGSIHAFLEEYETAINCFDYVLSVNANDIEVLLNKASCLIKCSMYNEAIDCFSKVLRIDKSYELAWTGKIECLINLELLSEALEVSEVALNEIPESSMLWYAKGVSWIQLKNLFEASNCLRMALNKDPWNELALDMYASVRGSILSGSKTEIIV